MAQKKNGYYGKNCFIQIESVMNYPFYYNVFSKSGFEYSTSSNSFKLKKNHFNIGFRVHFGYVLKRNIALSIEYGQDYSSLYLNNDILVHDPSGYGYEVQHEMLDVRTNVFIPKIEFTTSNSILPMGFSHQVGFGFSFSNAIEKDYIYRYEGSSEYLHYSTSSTGVDPINFSILKPVKKIVLLYALSMRSPITQSLMINYGIKYTLNIWRTFPYDYNNIYKSNLEYTASINSLIARQRMFSLINFNLGLTYVF